MLVKKKKAFTLVELLIVIAILLIMIVILIGILNPIALVNKAQDSRRKKDLNRIRVAFEEYFNDKGCYPNNVPDSFLRNQLNDNKNCGSSSVFGKWLKPWPCDSNGKPYDVLTGYDDDSNCPKWFKIRAVLENKKDPSINIVAVAENDPNYGVSSGNITPGGYLGDGNPACWKPNCSVKDLEKDGTCGQLTEHGCDGPNCYKGSNQCYPECQVTSCSP